MSNSKAFVSYSWATEHESGIVETLGVFCTQRGINLIRDNQVLQHGQLINQFMDKLSKGDHVITVFSKPYFQSKWCMYELLKIYQRGEFEQRTHPVITDDCYLQNQTYRLEIVKFWNSQYESAKSAIAGIDPAVVLEEQKRVNLYRDIYQNINELVNFAANRVTTPLATLKQQDYAPLLDRIKRVSPANNRSHEISDDDYLYNIRQSLNADLKKYEPFYEHVQTNCDIEIGGQQQLNDYLIEQSVSGEFVAVIQTLQSAFVDCYDTLGKNDTVELKSLYEAAQGSVSKLVLFNIKNDWMNQYRNSYIDSNGHEYLLPEMSLCGVEIVTSRQGQTIPTFKIDKIRRDLQSGKGLLLESGIQSKDVVRDIINRLYSKVLGRELTSNQDENELITKLQKTIQQRKQQKNIKLRKNYFLLFPAKGSHSGLSDPAVQDKLKQLLPDLAFIRLKSENLDETFIVEDEDLMVAIEEFFTTLEDKSI